MEWYLRFYILVYFRGELEETSHTQGMGCIHENNKIQKIIFSYSFYIRLNVSARQARQQLNKRLNAVVQSIGRQYLQASLYRIMGLVQ